MRRHKYQQYVPTHLSQITVWYDDGGIDIPIEQSDPLLQASVSGSGYDFTGAEYDIANIYNGKFYYVKNISGLYTHYFLITSATITALEVHYPFSANYITGDMEVYDSVQVGVTTLLIEPTILFTTDLIGG